MIFVKGESLMILISKSLIDGTVDLTRVSVWVCKKRNGEEFDAGIHRADSRMF